MPGGSAAKPPSPCCPALPQSQCPPAAPTGTGSTGSATASSTAPCTPSPSPGCAVTQPLLPTPHAAAPKAKPTAKSAAASSDTSPATSTENSTAGPSQQLDKHRSVRGSGVRVPLAPPPSAPSKHDAPGRCAFACRD